MATKAVSYSRFLRGPGEVIPVVAESDVILERRGEADLVLTSEERYLAGREGLGFAARLLGDLARQDPTAAERLLAQELPWLKWLPKDERRVSLQELVDDLRAGAEIGDLVPFVRDLNAWRSTAEVWSRPELARRLQGPLPGEGPELTAPDTPE